jgi:hypothetical protein
MYKLKALGDLHPTNLLVETVESSVKNNAERFIFWITAGLVLELKPTLMANETLMKGIEKYLSLHKGVNRCVVEQTLDSVRKIFSSTFKELKNKHQHIYMEGQFSSLGRLLQKYGTSITYLDSGNPFLRQIGEDLKNNNLSAYDKNQEQRESLWIEKIVPGNHLENALLFAGSDHIKNRWGLADKLRKKDIELTPLPEPAPISWYLACNKSLPTD